MEESPTEAKKREDMLRMYQSCKEALRIITDANLSNFNSELPSLMNQNDFRYLNSVKYRL